MSTQSSTRFNLCVTNTAAIEVVTHNTLHLSKDPYGSFVVQHVLKLCDLHCTYNTAVNLGGHCVELSFKKYGSYIVEKLLETEESMILVVAELLECKVDRLMRLARSEYGKFVVVKALRVTQEEMITAYLFWGLVHKLMPFHHLLRNSRGSTIAAILESTC